MKHAGRFVLMATCAGGLLFGAGGLATAQQMPSSDEASTVVSAQDVKLEKKIDYRLQHDQKLKARALDASVKDGVVTLTGTVRTSTEKSRAERLAHTKGVNDVENQINVEGQQESSGSAGTAAPQGGSEPATPAPSEGQQTQPAEGQVRERTTHTEERTETRTERTPQPSQDQQQQQQQAPSSAPSEQQVPAPAAPNAPQAPAPSPRSTTPQQ
jgi:hypothetical protein